MLTHVDLFSGFGMMALGIQSAGFDTRLFCEIEPYAQKVLRKHWPETPIESDVRNVSAQSLRRHGIERIDLLTGGFPCQDISVAGQGAGLEGERSGLWYEMLRVIRDCRPAFCLIENVPALRARGADTILQGLEEAGYSAECFVVGADDCGVPHRRKRVWIVGVAHAARQQTDAAEPRGLHAEPSLSRRELAHADAAGRGERCGEQSGREELPSSERGGAALADSNDRRKLQPARSEREQWRRLEYGIDGLFPPTRNDFGAWAAVAEMDASLLPCVERPVRGVVDGTSSGLQRHRSARLKGLGNGLIWVIPFLIGTWIRQQIEATNELV